jgi:hypothetical protein
VSLLLNYKENWKKRGRCRACKTIASYSMQ